MSTDLYGVRVLEVDEAASRLRLRVFVVYYDTHGEHHQPIPDDRSFFVRLLSSEGALGDDISSSESHDEAFIDRNAFRFVDRFVELERRNHPVESYESFQDFYYARDDGRDSSPDGDRFVHMRLSNDEDGDTETAQVLDGQGAVLMSFEYPADSMVYAAFDASKNIAAIAVEGQEAFLVSLPDGARRPFSTERINHLALSPDGRYVATSKFGGVGFQVIRVSDLETIRALTPAPQRIPTAVAWSPRGDLVATSCTDFQGYHSTIQLHRTGRVIEAVAFAPVEVPERRKRDIADVVSLYLERTASFAEGWGHHLDNDLMNMHLALQRMGIFSSDLVEHMSADVAKIATRSYESIIAQRRGDTDHARRALGDARARVGQAEIHARSSTFAYAPLAAAEWLAGDIARAEAAWEVAQRMVAHEANDFQKRATTARALIFMRRFGEVRAIIDAAKITLLRDWHQRIFLDLIVAGEWELLHHAFSTWRASKDWRAPGEIQAALIAQGAFERAVSLTWIGVEKSMPHTLEAWTRWFEVDPEAARAKLDAMMAARPDDATLVEAAALANGERASSSTNAPPEDPTARFQWLCAQGQWEAVYAEVNATRRTLRDPLFEVIASTATERGDLDVALDAMLRLPCSGMNSPGLRAMQRAFKTLAGRHHRFDHP